MISEKEYETIRQSLHQYGAEYNEKESSVSIGSVSIKVPNDSIENLVHTVRDYALKFDTDRFVKSRLGIRDRTVKMKSVLADAHYLQEKLCDVMNVLYDVLKENPGISIEELSRLADGMTCSRVNDRYVIEFPGYHLKVAADCRSNKAEDFVEQIGNTYLDFDIDKAVLGYYGMDMTPELADSIGSVKYMIRDAVSLRNSMVEMATDLQVKTGVDKDTVNPNVYDDKVVKERPDLLYKEHLAEIGPVPAGMITDKNTKPYHELFMNSYAAGLLAKTGDKNPALEDVRHTVKRLHGKPGTPYPGDWKPKLEKQREAADRDR